jgi:mannan endo-1,4-beta-mannosidase
VLRIYIDLGWGKEADFDRIFDIASKYGVYVILAFTDCCCSTDYPTLKKYFEVHAPFCNITNKNSIKAFKKLIKRVVERKNSINGKIYRDDPTILAWEIANELEYWHFSKSDVHTWLEDVSNYIKNLDKKHLVTIGIATDTAEFMQDSSAYKMFDVPALDFFSFHVYPSLQNMNQAKKSPRSEDIYKIRHIAKEFVSLNKPVILGEFGFSNSTDLNFRVRTSPDTAEIYNLTFKKYMDTAFSTGCSGVMFWGWGMPEEKKVPMWWSKESHSTQDKDFCNFLKKYQIPQ